MMMTPTKIDLEKLKKLVRLATNNPNEHEANLAAIKVCRMLLENDFACLTDKQIGRTETPDFKSSPYGGVGFDYEEIFRNMRKQQAKSQQSYNRETKNRPYENPFREGSWSGFNPGAIYENQCEKCHNKFIVPHADYREYGWVCAVCRNKQRANPYPPNTGDWKRPRPEKRVRKCSTCGAEVETKRITAVFRCDKCEWNDFMNHPKKKKKAQVPNCTRCKNPLNIYDGVTATWRCPCGSSYISEVEAAARGIKFT